MISLWEAAQGLLFIAVLGLVTRSAVDSASRPPRPPDPGPPDVEPVPIPTPRSARDEEHGTVPTG